MLGYQIFSDHRYKTHCSVSVKPHVVQEDCSYFDTEIPSVNIVPQQQISRFCRISPHIKKLHKVEILTVDIAANRNRCIHLQEVRLAAENLGATLYYIEGLLLGQATLATKVLLEELKARFGSVLLGEEL